MEKKAQFINLTAIIVYFFLIIIGVLMFVFWKDFRFYVIGGLFIAASLVYIINVNVNRTPKKNDTIIFLIIFIVGLGILIVPLLGLSQTTLSSTFTPVYCRQPVFTCCGDSVNTISFPITISSGFVCPSNANYCKLSSSTSTLYFGSQNCQNSYHATCSLLGNSFACDNKQLASQGTVIQKNSAFYACKSATISVEEHTNRLAFCGPSACDAGTSGVQINGADGCTFNPSAQYDNTGKLITYEASGTSYTVSTGNCVLNWQDGMRYICGNLEEKCSNDLDCSGHTYGNFECNSRTLVQYGCINNNLPTGVTKEASGTLFAGNAKVGQPDITGVLTRCDVISTKQVTCCGDTDCGSNAFCDKTTWTCKASTSCTKDTDCGVSQQCNINTKQILKPTCSSGKCSYTKVKDVTCCSTADCPTGYYCGDDYSCKESTNPKTQCPFDCCISSTNYFDKPCPQGQFCVNNKCQSSGCSKDSDCSNGQICKDGSCVDKTDETLKCSWYQESYQTTKTKWIIWPFWSKEEPYTGCKTAGWVTTVIIMSFLTLIIVLVVIITLPKKRKQTKRRSR